MLVAAEVKGELARIRPARACCRRAELAGLLVDGDGGVSTLDHPTARIAVHLAASLGIDASGPRLASSPARPRAGRHHLHVAVARGEQAAAWHWDDAAPCDRRAFLRGVLLARGSMSLGPSGVHVEFPSRARSTAETLGQRLGEVGIRSSQIERRGRHVVYLKGQEDVAGLLRITGANRGLLDFESGRVGRDVQNRLNRLLNAEEANLSRTVHAADRQLQAIGALEASGELEHLPTALREAARERRLHPEADLDALAAGLGISRSAANHRLRRLVELAAEAER